jgi:hypothetical protein
MGLSNLFNYKRFAREHPFFRKLDYKIEGFELTTEETEDYTIIRHKAVNGCMLFIYEKSNFLATR